MKFVSLSKAVFVAASTVFLMSCADRPTNSIATDNEIERIARPESYLRSFLLRDAYGSSEVLESVHKLGRETGCGAIKEAVDVAVLKYSPQWRSEMIRAYRESVPPDELALAVNKSVRSAQRLLRDYDSKIWTTMGKRTSHLDAEAKRMVVDAVSAKAAKDARFGPPSELQLRELMSETVDFELCPDLQAVIRLEDN